MLDRLTEKYRALTDREDGFTLIELLVVVVIIGILIAIAIPLYLNYQKGAKDKSAQSDLRGAVSTLQQCYSDNNNTYPTASNLASTGGTVASDMTGKVTLTCGTTTETINLSQSTHLSFAIDSNNVVTMQSWNTDGNRDGSSNSAKYTYVSNQGGSIS